MFSSSPFPYRAAVVALVLALSAADCSRKEEPAADKEAAPAVEEGAPERQTKGDRLTEEQLAKLDPEARRIVTTLILIAEAEPEEGPVPLEVTFKVEVDEPLVQPKYEWDFGDGSPESNEVSPKHTYRKPGLYTVTVEIKDEGTGHKGKDSVLVDAVEPEDADLT